jgi:hypothetical protein
MDVQHDCSWFIFSATNDDWQIACEATARKLEFLRAGMRLPAAPPASHRS